MDRKESRFWDIVKGIAIFLMLWGHCIQCSSLDEVNFFEDTVFKVIYTFHMPLFMLVSGYLFASSFQKRDRKTLLVHRIQGMLHPIFAATVMANVLMLLPQYVLSDRVNILFGVLFDGIEDSLWFLWSVLISSVVVGALCKCTEKTFLQFLMTLIGIPFILMTPQWNTTLFVYPYFVTGFFCGMHREKAKRIYKWLRFAALPVFPVLVCFYEVKHYIYVTPMYSETLGLVESLEIAAFRCVIGFVGCIWMLTLTQWLCHLGQKTPVIDALLTTVSQWGKNSLQIYCLSAPLLSGYWPHLYRKIMEPVGYNLFAQNRIVYDFLFTFILAVAYSVGLNYLTGLMRKTSLHKLIFGR